MKPPPHPDIKCFFRGKVEKIYPYAIAESSGNSILKFVVRATDPRVTLKLHCSVFREDASALFQDLNLGDSVELTGPMLSATTFNNYHGDTRAGLNYRPDTVKIVN